MSQIELPVVGRPGHPGRDSADRFHEECGVVGIWNHPEAARLAYLGLYALQHRGQEAAGIVATTPDRGGLVGVNGPGHVADVFDVEKLDALAGRAAIGHTRYSTAGDSSPKNIQPIQIECKFGHIAVCHNGNLVNAHILRHMLVQRGSIFRTTSDTEVLVHLFAKSGQTEELEAVAEAVRQAEGAFSLLFLTEDALYAVAGPAGFPAAAARQGRRRLRGLLGDLRARPAGRRVHPRHRGGRVDPDRRRRGPLAHGLRRGAGLPVHLRARLLRAARQPRLRPGRLQDPDQAGGEPRETHRRGRRRGGAGPRTPG